MLAADDYHHKRNERSTGALTLQGDGYGLASGKSPAAIAGCTNTRCGGLM